MSEMVIGLGGEQDGEKDENDNRKPIDFEMPTRGIHGKIVLVREVRLGLT